MTSIKSDETVGNGDIECIASKTSQATSGYIAKDLRNLCRSALLRSLRTDNCTDRIANINLIASPKWEDFLYALNSSKPSQQIEFESLARNQQRTVFAGYHALKRRVYQNIHWPLSSPESFRRIGTKPPMGLLLYGPSGCGKTFLVQTLAAESNFNFIPIKGPEIFSKYLGETEATLRRLFTMARQVAPCILFFDEMDSIGAKRGWGGDGDGDGDNQAGSSNGVNERVLSTLLNEMDGVEERTGVFVVGCTNQPQAMDDALLRPGRLDQLVYIGYPSLQDRFEIINEIGSRIPITKDIDTRQELAKHTVGFSPADLTALFREAAILSLRRNISSTIVEQADIKHVIQRMSPLVQGRVLQNAVDGNDVIVPDLYRKFYQRR
ncbi:P-loop containing nucleoside triphosphate hydrolase protein [Lobosporangium transversale]|uniref:p-loop containing nucleoside triphosphate hydrolase protein n=1 Tax=Lobosporangium transversale TaxID=64571 RepID=A0A1Y2GW17_9FUNG|nr:P-loop containing nucleoside triphosphate hydrolase protein [Lobosporangium transversale]ORZ26459.1 P-loop containing nucleoside triphosphate hydrolase protein [Lobosporangium transversale]|eukprot:XP_021884224.1 P-loop containing nucleoside triphosphate hydrolase protein [Lobosporangium transversale]